MINLSEISDKVSDLVNEGMGVMTRRDSDAQRWVDNEYFGQWCGGYASLRLMLGDHAELLPPMPNGYKDNKLINVQHHLGILKGLQSAIAKGHLFRLKDLVSAEIFDDLLDQAEHLLKRQYAQAAAILARAALEGHLKALCVNSNCAPSKDRPTIENYRLALVDAGSLPKEDALLLTANVKIGNDAAHDKPEFDKANVPGVLQYVREFMVKFPLAP